MSTKIYNGFRINTSNFTEVHKIVQEFRAKITPIMEARFFEMVCRQMVYRIDEDHFNPKCAIASCYLSDAIQFCAKRHEEVHRTSLRDPFFDFEFSIVLIPHGNITLGIFFVDGGLKNNKVASKLWMDQTGVGEYAYWNNVDLPDEISKNDWKRRGEIWVEALGHDTPSKRGYTWELFGPRGLPFPTWEQVRNHLGSVTFGMRLAHLEHYSDREDFDLPTPEKYRLPEITRDLAIGQ